MYRGENRWQSHRLGFFWEETAGYFADMIPLLMFPITTCRTMLLTRLGIYECGSRRKKNYGMVSYKLSPELGKRSKASQQFRGVVNYDASHDEKPRRAE
jgi:hypothetical protein